MKEYTATDRPLVSIVMAIYEPNLDWLRLQLESINSQTLKGLELNIVDDCSPNVPFDVINNLVQECIFEFPYTIVRNEKNLGSNKTFERLTIEARGDYIAYSDQDDIWLPEKLETLLNAIRDTDSILVCSDMSIIDEQGSITADSITQKRRHHVFHSGEGLASKLVFHNWVTGCTMMIQGQTAKDAVPFCPFMVHDHWLSLYSAEKGRISCLPKPLIQYRIHGGNQTLEMAGVTDRESYIAVRIEIVIKRLKWLKAYMKCGSDMNVLLHQGLIWAEARKSNLLRHGGKRIIWKYRRFSVYVSIFEIFAPMMSESLFLRMIDLKRKNRI